MGSCCSGPACEVSEKKGEGRTPCPRCGVVGRVVADETVEAILKPGAATSLIVVECRLCTTPSCDVLYYGADGRLALKSSARIRVGIKETEDPVPVCYCFGFSRADVRREVAQTGGSTIPAQITAHVRAGECACEVKNPSGACCLGEVNKAVKHALQAARAPRSGEDIVTVQHTGGHHGQR